MSFQSFAVTLRPHHGISDGQVDKFVKWCRKKCKYFYVITEKDDENRHLHAGLFLLTAMSQSNLCTTLLRLYKDLEDVEKRVFRNGIKVMYNMDWLDKYLKKGDSTIVVEDNLPESGHLESYFPEPKEKKKKEGANPYYEKLEKLWYEHKEPQYEINTINARHFLFKMMYAKDIIKVIGDDKKIIQTARHLVRRLKRLEESTIVLPPYEEEE